MFVAVITRPSAHPAPSAGTAVESHTTRLGGRKLFNGGSRAAGTYGHVKRVHSTRVPQPVALRWPTHGSPFTEVLDNDPVALEGLLHADRLITFTRSNTCQIWIG